MQNDRFNDFGWMVFPRLSLLIIGVVLILTSLGCRQSGSTLETPQLENSSQAESGLPPLQSVTRGVASASTTLLGAQMSQSSPDVVTEGTDILLSPPFEGISYALYAFAADPEDVVESVSFFARDRVVANTPVYLALSDYSKGSWQHLAPVAEDSGYVELDSSAGQFCSSFGVVYLAVIAYSGDGFALHSVEISFANRTEPVSGWPIGGHDGQRTGRSSQLVVESLNVHFRSTVPGNFATSAPCIGADGEIYLGSYSLDATGFLYAFAPDGSINWSYEALAPIYSSPVIDNNGTVYFGDDSKYLYALNRAGHRRWMFDAAREVRSSPLVGENGDIYFGTYGSNMMCVSPQGEELWNADTQTGIKTGIASSADGSTLYACTAGGDLVAVEPDGTQLWLFDGEGQAAGWPVVTDNGNVVYATESGNVYSVDSTGLEVGLFAAGGEFLSPPALGHSGQVYVGNMNGMLYELDSSASLVNSLDVGAGLRSSPAIDGDGTLFFGAMDGKILALNPDFSLQWEYQANDGFWSGPAIGDAGQLYIACKDGTLFAFTENAEAPPTQPTGLQASEGSFVNKIALSWDEQFDANGFEIYKDQEPTPVATVGYVMEWFDEGILDDTPHSYTIVATNEHGSSEPSLEVTGYASGVAPGAGEWNMFGADSANSGNCTLLGPHTENLEWSYSTGVTAYSSPVIGGAGEVYFTTSEADPKIISVSEIGEFRWEYQATSSMGRAVAVDENGYVYAAEVGRVFRLTPDGTEDWSVAYTNYNFGAPTLTSSELLISGEHFSEQELTLSLNPADGTENWSFNRGARNCVPAVGSGGLVYVTDQGGNRVYVLNPDGTENTTHGGSGTAEGPPGVNLDPVDGDTILFVSGDKIYAWQNNAPLFNYQPAASAVTGFAVSHDGLNYYICGTTSALLDLAGTVAWDSGPNGNGSHQIPAVDSDGYFYVGRSSGAFRCIAPDGNLAWEYETGTDLRYSSAAIGPANRVYILGENGTLYAFSPSV